MWVYAIRENIKRTKSPLKNISKKKPLESWSDNRRLRQLERWPLRPGTPRRWRRPSCRWRRRGSWGTTDAGSRSVSTDRSTTGGSSSSTSQSRSFLFWPISSNDFQGRARSRGRGPWRRWRARSCSRRRRWRSSRKPTFRGVSWTGGCPSRKGWRRNRQPERVLIIFAFKKSFAY